MAEVSRRFTEGFDAIARRHPDWLHGPHGLGAMLAFTPFEGEKQSTRRVLDELFEQGVIAFSTAGVLSRVRFLPPVAVIQNEQIDTVLEILEACLAVVATERGA